MVVSGDAKQTAAAISRNRYPKIFSEPDSERLAIDQIQFITLMHERRDSVMIRLILKRQTNSLFITLICSLLLGRSNRICVELALLV